MSRILIIAYGNPMRGDDGLAWRAADELEAKLSSSEIEIQRLHQLAPELAETISHVAAVIFVDAAAAQPNRQPGDIRCEPITEISSEGTFSHQFSPHAVVALARQLYNANPRAFSVTMTGQDFNHAESLSPPVAAALPALINRIESVVQSLLR
ncbi:MAG: hydrogenase maturation protease [Candidatus Sulfotelmatobacter sp.]